MCSRMVTWKTVVLFTYCVQGLFCVRSVLAKVSSDGPKDFRIITYDELLQWQLAEFTHPDIIGSVQITPDLPRNQVLVGARGCLFRLSIDSLSELEMAAWKTDNMTKLICRAKGQAEEDCHNFIRVLLVHNGEVFTCGTNAFSPECSWRMPEDLNTISKTISGVAKCPFDPHYNGTVLISSDGDLYSATATDINGQDPAIHRIMGPSKYLRTAQHNTKWLNDPDFVSTYEIGDFIYFFFREAAIEYINCGKKVYSRIARLCKTDKGGNFLLEDNWTTFLKARLNCSIPGEYPFYFNEIQSTFYLEEAQLLYAIFTTPGNSMLGSAVCVYNMTSISASFGGDFKYQENSKSAWHRRDNLKRIQQCGVRNTDPHKRSFYMAKHLVDAQKYQLMDEAVQPLSVHPLHVGRSQRWTHIIVDHIQGKHHHTYPVVFVATATGKILKLVQIPRSNETCVIEEISVVPNGDEKPVQNLKIVPGKGVIIVSTREKIFSLALQRCDRFKSREMCLNSMDPYCGWDSFFKACTLAPGGNPHVHYWHQQITSCPKLNYPVNGGWSKWSSWRHCQHKRYGTSEEDHCWCHTRSCNNPMPYYGGTECEGVGIEVTNCTVHGEWTSWSDWSSCSKTCGTAIKYRQRWCSNPPAAFGGRKCVGPSKDEQYCMKNPLCPRPPLHGNWAIWTAWSDCTSNCNGGIQTRRRSCDDPRPGRGGMECVGNRQEWRMCNTHLCDVRKKATHWTPWIRTNKTKGGYFEQRFRFVCRANVPEEHMIKPSFMKTDVQFCFDKEKGCHASDISLVDDVDGAWSAWQQWSPCNAQCDGGLQWRRRSCDSPQPMGDGQECLDHPVEARHCNAHSCQGVWACWSDLAPCSVTCGPGIRTRIRICQAETPGGEFTEACDGHERHNEPCFLENCNTSVGWAGWSVWSKCGPDGTQYRERSCNASPRDLPSCAGDAFQVQSCDFDVTVVGEAASLDFPGPGRHFEVTHLVIIGIVAFIVGGAVSMGVMLYIQRQSSALYRIPSKSKLEKNNRIYDDSVFSPFLLNHTKLRPLSLNLNNEFYMQNSLGKDKLTVKEATLKRNSLMRTNLSLNDL